MEASIALRQISKQYASNWVLENITLGVERNQCTAVVGPAGAGKSILLKIVATLVEPTHGTGYVQGLNITARADQIRRFLGYLPQETLLDPRLSLLENLILFGYLRGFSETELRSRIAGMARRFELVEALKLPVEKAPFGVQRLVAFMAAVLHQPQVLVLDQPTAGLDVSTASKVWQYLMELKGHVTLVFTPSNAGELDLLADRILVLKRGRALFEGAIGRLNQVFPQRKVLELELKQINDREIAMVRNLEGVISISQRQRRLEIQMDGDITEEIMSHFPEEVIVATHIRNMSSKEIIESLLELEEHHA